MFEGVAFVIRRILAKEDPVEGWLPVRLVRIVLGESCLVAIDLHDVGDLRYHRLKQIPNAFVIDIDNVTILRVEEFRLAPPFRIDVDRLRRDKFFVGIVLLRRIDAFILLLG